MAKTKVAIIGSGNIGTDLMIKVMRLSKVLEMGVMVGIDPASDGLARAARMGVATTHEGIDGLIAMPEFADVEIVFDATSAGAHRRNNELVQAAGKRMVDLTPAAIGPYVIPPVNGEKCLDARNVNMVTCGGQATIPIVAAVHRVSPVIYGEIVASTPVLTPVAVASVVPPSTLVFVLRQADREHARAAALPAAPHHVLPGQAHHRLGRVRQTCPQGQPTTAPGQLLLMEQHELLRRPPRVELARLRRRLLELRLETHRPRAPGRTRLQARQQLRRGELVRAVLVERSRLS